MNQHFPTGMIASTVLTLLCVIGPSRANAQQSAADRDAEARFFRAVMEAMQDASTPAAIDSSRSPQLVDPRTSAVDDEPGDATRYGVAPVRPPLDLPYAVDSGLSLPFGLDSLTNDEILGYIAYYCTEGRRQLSRWIARSGRYEDMIKAEAHRQGAPEDLLWVVAVESGFDPFAVSSAGAVGLWQFMPRTARYLGLEISRDVDERRDPMISTAYAIDYLQQLYHLFESWPLALAAYNAGLGHVRSELRRANATDFEKLDDYQAIYANARNYAGRIIAIATIMRNPEHFAFDRVVRGAPMSWDEVEAEPGTSFVRIAERASTSTERIAELNPAFLNRATPRDGASTVRIPAGSFDSYVAATGGAATSRTTTHRLRFGETIDAVASRYGLRAYRLRAMNGFGSREHVPYGTVLELPADARAQPTTGSRERSPAILPETEFSFPDRVRIFYEVQSGDRLSEIAEHFQVDLYRLAAWNDLDVRATLWSGMVLQIFVPESIDLGETIYLTDAEIRPIRLFSDEYWEYRRASRERAESRARTHTVRRGDTVFGIANDYGVRSRDIIRWNNLDEDGHIVIGQELRVAP